MPFDVEFLKQSHKAILEKITAEIDKALNKAAEIAKAEVAADMSFGGVKLKNSIRSKRLKTGIKIFTRRQTARYVEDGTRPHPIFPRRKKWLRWMDASGNQHWRKFVNHPGTKPNPFLKRATLKAFDRAIRQDLTQALKNLKP